MVSGTMGMSIPSSHRPGAVHAAGLALLLASFAWPTAAPAQGSAEASRRATMSGAAAAADAQMSDTDPFSVKEHIALSPQRPWNPADSARAAEIAVTLRRALERYRDVEAAKEDGYQIFAPDVPGQRLYHFTNYAYATASEASFDPTKPTSLLYRKSKSGGWTLEGVMYTAHADLPLEELDRRVPLSVARWHRHINFCLPPWGGSERWRETRNGKPVFGPMGVATEEECEAAGGRFVPQLFGWMLHAMPFGSDDPRVIFGGRHEPGSGHAH